MKDDVRPFWKMALVISSLAFLMAVPVPNTEAVNTSANLPSDSASQQKELPTGTWGGEHISLELTADGGRVEFDCAHGTLAGKIKLDQQGRFSVKGTYSPEHGGPERESDKANDHPVIYVGQLKGEKLQLTIKRSDNKKLIGTFALTHGQEAFLVKCR